MSESDWINSSIDARKSEVEVDFIKAKSNFKQVEKIFIDFYKELNDIVEPNHFDEWVGIQFQLFNQSWRLPILFMELAETLGVLKTDMIYEGEEGVVEILFQICAQYLKDKNNVKRNIRAFINQKWDLIESRKIHVKINRTKELEDEILNNIKLAKKTRIEELAEKLDTVVFIGKENWLCILYSLMSTHVPDINMNGVIQRGNLHTNLVGEISTAKSKILNVLKMVAPKWVNVTKTTEASFEGISKFKEIAQGIIEASEDGILLIPEFKRAISKFALLREAMDCDWIDISKRGISKRFHVNTSFIVASNPRDDFFPISGALRASIPFEEGVLSRFDFVIPFITTEEKNAEIVEKLKLFGGKMDASDYAEIKTILQTIMEGMKIIKNIIITPEQEEMMKEAFLRNNVKFGNRTLVILRDLETMCRLLNVIVISNFFNRVMNDDREVEVQDVDVLKAIELWENIIYLRKQIYEMRDNKEIMFAEEAILYIIEKNQGEIPSRSLFAEMMNMGISKSERSCSRRVKKMLDMNLLKMETKKKDNGEFSETVYLIQKERVPLATRHSTNGSDNL